MLNRFKNIEWTGRVAWGEARGEGDRGLQAVINVMRNRVDDGRFGRSLAAVVTAPFQFSAFNDNDPNREKLEQVTEDDPIFVTALNFAKMAEDGNLPDITGGAIFYHANTIARPSFLRDAVVTTEIGNHIFYKEA